MKTGYMDSREGGDLVGASRERQRKTETYPKMTRAPRTHARTHTHKVVGG